MTADKNIILIGFDLDTIDLIESSQGYTLCGYTDKQDLFDKFSIDGIPYVGNDAQWIQDSRAQEYRYVLGMDQPNARQNAFARYQALNVTTLISRSAHVSPRAKIDTGSVIQHNATVMPMASIGKGCLLNVNSSIHHESTIGDFSVLAPGSLVLGRVEIGRQVYIGAGAIIRENCVIGSNSCIGAGAVVINDIPQNSTVVGVPATKYIHRKNDKKDRNNTPA